MPLHLFNNSLIVTDNKTLRSSDSVWYHCLYIGPEKLRVAGGPTETDPDSNTLGGWQLNAATEYLYSFGLVCSDWDSNSDILLCVAFEVNVNNEGGNITDTVDLSLTLWYKGLGEVVSKTQTIENSVVVGQSPRYKQFVTTFVIDWDKVDNVFEPEDILALRLNLETDSSEVDDIIVNFMSLKYKTTYVKEEV